MHSFNDHFSGHAAAYAAYRPRYSPAFISAIVALAPSRQLAWDCATGNGQAARLIAPHFACVIATDASVEQIANAALAERVDFRVGLEDESGASDRSVDLVTVATALHWFDLDRFYREVRRVLVPDGILAAWCYGFARISPEIDGITRWFANVRVGDFWPPQRVHVDRGYRDLPFPFQDLSIGAHEMTFDLTLDQYVGYVGTWSSVQSALNTQGVDPIPEFRNRLRRHWHGDEAMRVSWPLHYRIGRNAHEEQR